LPHRISAEDCHRENFILEAVKMKIDLELARKYINQLDLAYIEQAMCASSYPLPRWTMVDAKHCCQLYKNFLFLAKKHLPLLLVPTREIDEFWHNHILYTKNYHQDCMQIFGHYLHHQPADPNDPVEKLIHDFSITKQLYLEEFKQPLMLQRTS
jgi:hypothetical protein